jgi:hypothetical protein
VDAKILDFLRRCFSKEEWEFLELKRFWDAHQTNTFDEATCVMHSAHSFLLDHGKATQAKSISNLPTQPPERR